VEPHGLSPERSELQGEHPRLARLHGGCWLAIRYREARWCEVVTQPGEGMCACGGTYRATGSEESDEGIQE